jgi:hypothetical protein
MMQRFFTSQRPNNEYGERDMRASLPVSDADFRVVGFPEYFVHPMILSPTTLIGTDI